MKRWSFRPFDLFTSQKINANVFQFLLLLICIALPAVHNAKVFQGLVLDKITGKPLADANVIILDKKNFHTMTSTDSTGFFHFQDISLDRFNLIVKRVGYTDFAMGPLLMSKIDTLKIVVKLEPSEVVMNEVVVENKRIEELLLNVGFADRKQTDIGNFWTYKDFEDRPHTKASEIFKSIPQLMVNESTGTITLHSLRYNAGAGLWGKEPPKLFMYLDGVLVENHDFVNMMDIKHIAGIEFYRSTTIAPLKYSGNSRPGGVLLIWTKKGAD